MKSDAFLPAHWAQYIDDQKKCSYWPYTRAKLSGVDEPDEHGRTRLMRAVERRDAAAAESFLQQGANFDLEAVYPYQGMRPRYAGINAFILAVDNDDLVCVRLLLSLGMRPNTHALYTDPGMGNYTVYPRDKCRSHEMGALLDAYRMSPQRGEWARMLDRCKLEK